ncbi:MAG: glycosyltransferase family 4 protein [Candidatus Bathyarchaeia archaeon]
MYHGVLDDFRSNRIRRPPRRHVILWVSRLANFKEPFVLLEAIRLIKDKADFIVLLRGDGPLKSRILEYLRVNGLSGRVHLINRVPFKSLPRLYRSSSFLVHTCSREPFGLAVLEAMASGLPVVVPDSGGAAEVAGNAALRYYPGEAEKLADKILSILGDDELYTSLSAKSLKRAESFSWVKSAGEYLKVYSRIAGG